MPSSKQTDSGTEVPDPTAYYESAGTEILTAYAREEMSTSVARLKRDLRTAFSAKAKPQQSRPEQRRS